MAVDDTEAGRFTPTVSRDSTERLDDELERPPPPRDAYRGGSWLCRALGRERRGAGPVRPGRGPQDTDGGERRTMIFVCNEYTADIWFAISHLSTDHCGGPGGDWRSAGWWYLPNDPTRNLPGRLPGQPE
jgi:hypothetical protein